MAYDDTSRRQDANAYNAEIGFVPSSPVNHGRSTECMALAVFKVSLDFAKPRLTTAQKIEKISEFNKQAEAA